MMVYVKDTQSFWFGFNFGSSHRGSVETNPIRNHEVSGSISSLTQWVKDPTLPVSCGVGRRLQLQFDPLPGNLHMPWVWP